MKRVPIITDTHLGCRAEHKIIAENQEYFWDSIFWPAIDAAGDVTDILHLGDLCDRRKYINLEMLQRGKEHIFEPARARGIKFHWVLGNHDIYHKNDLSINAAEAFREFENLVVYKQATELTFNDKRILLLPWICDENYQDSMDKLANFDGAAVAGHLELAGFEMYKGVPNNHGASTEPYRHVPLVMTGHYHHKSNRGNIHYLGSPFEMSWADYGDKRGFHWWTPETNTLELVENTEHLYYRYVYDDEATGKSQAYVNDAITEIRKDNIKGKIVKILVKSKTQPIWFDAYIDAIQRMGVFDIQIVEDLAAWNTETESLEDDDNTMDSLTMISWYIDNQTWPSDGTKKAVKDLMNELYTEATDLAKTGVRA